MHNDSRKACDASDREGLKISMSHGRDMEGKGLKMAKLASYDLWMFPKIKFDDFISANFGQIFKLVDIE